MFVKREDNAAGATFSNADIPDPESPGDDEEVTELHSEKQRAMYSSIKDPGFVDYHVKALDSSVQVHNDDGSTSK